LAYTKALTPVFPTSVQAARQVALLIESLIRPGTDGRQSSASIDLYLIKILLVEAE
jgi:hypothetical protein